jgi:hypothetical protein
VVLSLCGGSGIAQGIISKNFLSFPDLIFIKEVCNRTFRTVYPDLINGIWFKFQHFCALVVHLNFKNHGAKNNASYNDAEPGRLHPRSG